MKTINCIERRVVLDTTLCDKVCQLLAASWWFSPGTPVSSTNKTNRHDITEKPAGLDNACMSTYSYVCVDIELNTLRKKNKCPLVLSSINFVNFNHDIQSSFSQLLYHCRYVSMVMVCQSIFVLHMT